MPFLLNLTSNHHDEFFTVWNKMKFKEVSDLFWSSRKEISDNNWMECQNMNHSFIEEMQLLSALTLHMKWIHQE